jgi:hypothetical protein
MDGRFRRHFKGTPKHVKIGYGSNSKTRFLMPDGFYKFRVSNVKEVELLLMHNKKYAAGKFPFLPVPPFPRVPPSSRSTLNPFRQCLWRYATPRNLAQLPLAVACRRASY